jgi:hypothetical protein
MSANVDQSFFGIHENIILTKNGTWLSNGEEITHLGTLKAFSRNIFRCTDGWEIRLGPEKKTIHVEDTIYFVTKIDGSTELGFSIFINDGRVGELDLADLKYKPGRLTVKIPHSNNGTNEEAKFLTAAYHELLKFITKDDEGFKLTVEGKTVLLSKE